MPTDDKLTSVHQRISDICVMLAEGHLPRDIAELYGLPASTVGCHETAHLFVTGRRQNVRVDVASRLCGADHRRLRERSVPANGWRTLEDLAEWARANNMHIDARRVRMYAGGLPVPWLDAPKPAPKSEVVTETAAPAHKPTRADLLRDISARLRDVSELIRALAEVTDDHA